MLTLPDAIVSLVSLVSLLTPFSALFQRRTWLKPQLLPAGAILSPGKRTVTSALRVMGLSDERGFAQYHHVLHVLNRAAWPPLRLGRTLLRLLLQHLDQGCGPWCSGLVFGLGVRDRRDPGAAAGPADQCQGNPPGRSALQRESFRQGQRPAPDQLDVADCYCYTLGRPDLGVAFSDGPGPFGTILPEKGKDSQEAPKKLTGSSPTGRVRLSASSYAVLELLHFCQSLAQPVTVITRLRLDAALYEPAPPRRPGRNGRPRVKGKRLPKLRELPDSPDTCWAEAPAAWYDGAARTVEFASQTALRRHSGKPPAPIRWALIRDPLGQFRPQALLSTGLAATRIRIVEWFVLRRQLEATFQEVRAHLGVETQRRWSDRAIARTTPVLMGLFSRITLASRLRQKQRPMIRRTAAWCAKPAPTFVDAIARVRRHLWPASESFSESFSMSAPQLDSEKVPTAFYARLIDSLATLPKCTKSSLETLPSHPVSFNSPIPAPFALPQNPKPRQSS